MEKVKNTPGYLKSKKEVEKLLSKSTAKYNNCAVVTKSLANKSIYCYSYKIANELADYLEKSKNIKRSKSNDITIDRTPFKYIIICE